MHLVDGETDFRHPRVSSTKGKRGDIHTYSHTHVCTLISTYAHTYVCSYVHTYNRTTAKTQEKDKKRGRSVHETVKRHKRPTKTLNSFVR